MIITAILMKVLPDLINENIIAIFSILVLFLGLYILTDGFLIFIKYAFGKVKSKKEFVEFFIKISPLLLSLIVAILKLF
ncbi:hypothetical protein DFR56_1207 [Pseudogracilibacillus auburnensis]|uniref:Uncharacterized protein n=1 Tax=Pseudogracilibacillus auburnensis TaxID=1494959 RepID=A0A2V3VK81_9BACI|nr:hypothetical protein DFR56_1207 [Pseudogracilibacillus auburnensis]